MFNRPVLLKPLVSEKSMRLIKQNLYTFLVDRDADKKLIGRIVAKKFAVDVLRVSTVNIQGKNKLQRTRKGYFQTAHVKKAIVQLKKGQKIALFEQATEDEVEVKTAEGEVIAKTKEKKSLLGRTKVRISKLSPAEIELSGKIQESSEKNKKKKPKKKGEN